jgi:hypothetical protein
MAQSITLSSVGTAAMILNPVAKSTTFQLVVPSSGVVSVEVTLDDPTIYGGPSTTWTLLSSGAAMASSTVGTGGLIYTVLSPLGGARLNSSVNGAGGTFTLKALQSVSA